MKYYINRKIDATFDQAVDRVKELLQIEGFGVLSEVDLSEKIKEKLNVNFRRYKILSAYDTAYAYKALKKDDKIGIMLACNIIIQELRKNEVEVAAIDPVATSMSRYPVPRKPPWKSARSTAMFTITWI